MAGGLNYYFCDIYLKKKQQQQQQCLIDTTTPKFCNISCMQKKIEAC